MSTNVLSVALLSPAKPRGEFKAKSVLLPGADGYMQLLPGHTTLISEVGAGRLVIDPAVGEATSFFIDRGHVEVREDQVVLLLEVIDAVGDLDIDRAKDAEERALTHLKNTTSMDIDIPRALNSLKRARARQELLKAKN